MPDLGDLISPSYIRLGSGHTLRETLGIAVAAMERDGSFPAMVILDSEGDVSGIVSPLALLQGLCADETHVDGSFKEAVNEDHSARDFLERAQGRLQSSVFEAAIKDPPLLRAHDSIVDAIRKVVRAGLDFLPVAEGRRAIGVVHTATLFRRVASMALDEPLDVDEILRE